MIKIINYLKLNMQNINFTKLKTKLIFFITKKLYFSKEELSCCENIMPKIKKYI
jgi:hypothetical protein